ncbi:MAG: DUF4290 domain-containing protein, partial [Flavobacteriaceae bacterium]|nr:DUF4290 domain-containing protein [Flavobacteriaceae bacterium]
NGAELFDDYGHHPREIASMLAVARKRTKGRLIVVFQPHRYSRTHKLWDQFFIMADFDIDVDSPFEKPRREVLYQKPDNLNYPQQLPKYRFYGNSIPSMIDIALSWEDGPKREALIINIANHMKKCFLNWNKDTVEDSVIFNHLYEMSDGKINLAKKDHDLADSKDLISKVSPRTKPPKKNYRKTNRKKNRY